MAPDKHSRNGGCQLIGQKFECQYIYWIDAYQWNEPIAIKHPRALSLGSVSPQLSSGEHTGYWNLSSFSPSCINQAHLSSLAFGWNVGTSNVSYPARCWMTNERICRHPYGVTKEATLWSSQSHFCLHLTDILHRAADQSFWSHALNHITFLIISLKASLWV